MRWLGVDPGEARVGIAACDDQERIAVPLEIVPASVAFPAIRSIAGREEIGGVVVGLALSLDGTEGAQALRARKLGDRIARSLGLPVWYEDERLSTVAAGRDALDDRPRDDIAAALILQQFIDRRRREKADAAP